MPEIIQLQIGLKNKALWIYFYTLSLTFYLVQASNPLVLVIKQMLMKEVLFLGKESNNIVSQRQKQHGRTWEFFQVEKSLVPIAHSCECSTNINEQNLLRNFL